MFKTNLKINNLRDGATFTPEFKNNTLVWTNDQNLDNPAPFPLYKIISDTIGWDNYNGNIKYTDTTWYKILGEQSEAGINLNIIFKDLEGITKTARLVFSLPNNTPFRFNRIDYFSSKAQVIIYLDIWDDTTAYSSYHTKKLTCPIYSFFTEILDIYIQPAEDNTKVMRNGYLPIKGIDYYTDNEIEEVKQDLLMRVLASLPTWNGGGSF